MSEIGRKILAIPGPIEISPLVQQALSLPPLSPISPEFVKILQESLHMTRQVVRTIKGHPFIIAGSGRMAWEQVGANLIEKGDRALVLNTGYFGTEFQECLETYGAQVDVLKAPIGCTVQLRDIERALEEALSSGVPYKAVGIVHVDTSTGVLSDVATIAKCIRRVSGETLIVLDAVCSVASEDVQMDSWDLDAVLAASQKGLGAPPGLSIVVASSRAIRVWEERLARGIKSGSYYSSWEKWIPVMRAYDEGRPAYFATPAVNLVRAYHTSLSEITKGSIGLVERLQLHILASQRIKRAAEQLGMTQVTQEESARAHGVTALYLPEGVTAGDVLSRAANSGVVMAGGLVSEIKDQYIRIGHMGWSVVHENGIHLELMVRALEKSVRESVGAMRTRL